MDKVSAMTVCKNCGGNEGYCDCIEKCWQCGSIFMTRDDFGSYEDKIKNISLIADIFHLDMDKMSEGKFATCPTCNNSWSLKVPCHYFLWRGRRFGFYSYWREFFNAGLGSAEKRMMELGY
jgi:hypothetical protein